jgi:hypothetical protein
MTTQPAPAEIKHLLRVWGESGGPPSGRAAGHLLLFAGLVVDGCVQLTVIRVNWCCGLRVSPGEDQPAEEQGDHGVAGEHCESAPGRQPAWRRAGQARRPRGAE